MSKAVTIIVLSLMFSVVSCDLETSNNGDLDGLWQLRSVDTLSTGASGDMRESGVYWAFQFDLMEAQMVSEDGIFFRFTITADSLLLSDPYIDKRDSSDIALTDPTALYPYGIHALDEGFAVLSLSSSAMQLQCDELRLTFRKY